MVAGRAAWGKTAQAGEVDHCADRLFITKVPQTLTREDIAAHFSRFGVTTDVYLPFIPGAPGHKGIAFVSFQDPASVQLAIANGPHEISGQEVVVDVAAPRGTHPQAAGFLAPAPVVQVQEVVQEQASGDRLFVTKVPPMLQREHMREHFAQFGELTDVYMPAVPGGHSHKGICFVSFADPTSLQIALSHSPHEINGSQVVVDVAAPRGPVPRGGAVPGGGGGCGGGFGGGFAGHQGYSMGGGMHVSMPSASPAWGGGHMVSHMGGHLGGGVQMGGMGGIGMAVAGFAQNAAPPAMSSNTGIPVAGRLFVTRVAPDMTKADLQLYFGQFGELQDVYIPSGGKGIAFVSYIEAAVAQHVLQSQQHFVKPGKAVLVDQALDRPPLLGKGGGNAVAFGGGAYGGGNAAFGGAAWGAPRQTARYAPY